MNQTSAMEQIQKHLPKLDEGYALEVYTNQLHNAVLVSISPNGIEHHIDIDLTDIAIGDMVQLEYLGIDVCIDENHSEPRSVLSTNQSDKYANTNSFDEQYTQTK